MVTLANTAADVRRADVDRQWTECLERCGSPAIECSVGERRPAGQRWTALDRRELLGQGAVRAATQFTCLATKDR